MNRREFTQGLAAAAAAPALPIKAIAATGATTGAAAATATAGNFTPYAYTCAVHYAQMMGSASPEILIKEFGIPASSARAITARLIKKGILLAPNAIGVSRAAQAVTPVAKPVAPTLAKAASKPPKIGKLAKELLLEDEEPLELDAQELPGDEA